MLQTFAEQAVIAISSAETYRALQERTEALATRNSEYGERIEQQSATIDVLKLFLFGTTSSGCLWCSSPSAAKWSPPQKMP